MVANHAIFRYSEGVSRITCKDSRYVYRERSTENYTKKVGEIFVTWDNPQLIYLLDRDWPTQCALFKYKLQGIGDASTSYNATLLCVREEIKQPCGRVPHQDEDRVGKDPSN